MLPNAMGVGCKERASEEKAKAKKKRRLARFRLKRIRAMGMGTYHVTI